MRDYGIRSPRRDKPAQSLGHGETTWRLAREHTIGDRHGEGVIGVIAFGLLVVLSAQTNKNSLPVRAKLGIVTLRVIV